MKIWPKEPFSSFALVKPSIEAAQFFEKDVGTIWSKIVTPVHSGIGARGRPRFAIERPYSVTYVKDGDWIIRTGRDNAFVLSDFHFKRLFKK